MTALVVVDTVILQPVLPASGLSACPGQDVTLNCTIVRMTTQQGVTPPPPTVLNWQYRGDTITYNVASDSSDYYTAVVGDLSPTTTIHSETITIAGNEV